MTVPSTAAQTFGPEYDGPTDTVYLLLDNYLITDQGRDYADRLRIQTSTIDATVAEAVGLLEGLKEWEKEMYPLEPKLLDDQKVREANERLHLVEGEMGIAARMAFWRWSAMDEAPLTMWGEHGLFNERSMKDAIGFAKEYDESLAEQLTLMLTEVATKHPAAKQRGGT